MSLVKLPSDLRISILFGKHAREETATPGRDAPGAPALAEEEAGAGAGTPTSATAPASASSPYARQPGATVAMLDM